MSRRQSQNENLFVHFDCHILEGGMKDDGQIGGNGPGGRRPYQNGDLPALQGWQNPLRIRYHRKLHIDGGRAFNFVFHFRLS